VRSSPSATNRLPQPVRRGAVFVVRLRTDPTIANPIRDLRALLKIALRRFGLRCVNAVEVQNDNRPICGHCGQPLPEVRLGAPMTPLKARIFDAVCRAGPDGIAGGDLHELVLADRGAGRATLKSHCWQINSALEDVDAGYRIVGGGGRFRLKARTTRRSTRRAALVWRDATHD
jgi:hypothetical protein